MALLKGLFGRGEPAPETQIHPEDRDLVTEADRNWWATLTLKNCQSMEHQDNIFKVAALKQYMETDGLSEEEAARLMRKSFVSYYAYLEERVDEPLGFRGGDAKLPYILKDRVNRAMMSTIQKMHRDSITSASSVNALIRSLIREGRI